MIRYPRVYSFLNNILKVYIKVISKEDMYIKVFLEEYLLSSRYLFYCDNRICNRIFHTKIKCLSSFIHSLSTNFHFCNEM